MPLDSSTSASAMTRLLAVSLVVALFACGGSEQRSKTTAPGWSEAGRRAKASHAWHCIPQGAPATERRTTIVRGQAGRRTRDARCDPARFLCQQIHRGAQATDEEKAECAGYEAVHGRVSER